RSDAPKSVGQLPLGPAVWCRRNYANGAYACRFADRARRSRWPSDRASVGGCGLSFGALFVGLPHRSLYWRLLRLWQRDFGLRSFRDRLVRRDHVVLPNWRADDLGLVVFYEF